MIRSRSFLRSLFGAALSRSPAAPPLPTNAQVHRHLVHCRFPASVDPAAVNEIFWDLLRVGNPSSLARSPRLDATVALAFVKSEYSKPGTPVYTVRAGERFEGTLCEVPFR